MRFPPPWAMARLGEAVSDVRNDETISRLEYWLAQYREEYANLIQYTDHLKKLYLAVSKDAFETHGIDDYPFPPAGFITSLGARLTGINFFESGSTLTPKENRRYCTSFPRAHSRFIYWELNMKHIPPASRIDYQITTYWYPPNLDKYYNRPTFHTDFYILPEWERSHVASGYGFNEAGKLPVGTYRLEFWIGEEFIAQGQFEVY